MSYKKGTNQTHRLSEQFNGTPKHWTSPQTVQLTKRSTARGIWRPCPALSLSAAERGGPGAARFAGRSRDAFFSPPPDEALTAPLALTAATWQRSAPTLGRAKNNTHPGLRFPGPGVHPGRPPGARQTARGDPGRGASSRAAPVGRCPHPKQGRTPNGELREGQGEGQVLAPLHPRLGARGNRSPARLGQTLSPAGRGRDTLHLPHTAGPEAALTCGGNYRRPPPLLRPLCPVLPPPPLGQVPILNRVLRF